MLYRVQLKTPISRINNEVNEMLNKIAQIAREIDATREDSVRLERTRDQYIIHLQQCQEDHNALRKVYKKLKLRLDQNEIYSSDINSGNSTTNKNRAMQNSVINDSMARLNGMGPRSNLVLCPPAEFVIKTNGKFSLKSKFQCLLNGLICSVAYKKDGTAIAFSNGLTLFVIDSETGQTLTQCEVPGVSDMESAHCRSIAFSPDGKSLAFSGSGNQAYIMRSHRNRNQLQTLIGHTKEVSAVLFDKNGEVLITGGFDGLIILWDSFTGDQIRSINTEGPAIIGIAPSNNFSFYAVAFTNGNVKAYSTVFDRPITFPTKQNSLMCVAVSPRDDIIATAGQDGSVNLWTINMVARPHGILRGHVDFTLAAAFSPNDILVTGSKDQTLRVWEYQAGIELAEITAHDNTIFAVAHHPTKREFVSVSGDGALISWMYSTK